MTIVGLYDDIFLAHHEWRHPERPERLHAIRRVLEECGMLEQILWPDVPAATDVELCAVHDERLWRQVRRLSQQGGGRFDADTFVNAFSFDAACHAAGATIAAARAAVLDDAVGLALVRPPGHHATGARAMGFCLFNNVAVAARYALDELGLERVFILDWDVHHGNGTQEIFYAEPRVFFASIHQFPFYPGTGHWEQIGDGPGRGTTLNVPLPPGHDDASYERIFERLIEPAIARFDPQLILLSAGFDAHWRDPLAGMQLTISGYHRLATRLGEAARVAGAGLAMVLEGGYDLEAVAHGVRATLLGLGGRALALDPLGVGQPRPVPDPTPIIERLLATHPIFDDDGPNPDE